MELSDVQLVRASQAGDAGAFEQLVVRYQALIAAVAIAQMAASPSLVEDVVQETFIAAWTQCGSLQDPNKFRSWICTIARNQAAKIVRKGGREIAHAEPGKELRASCVEEEYLAREKANSLVQILERIEPSQREALVLYYREEQSVQQVAKLLGLSAAAAQKRISRARTSARSQEALLSNALPLTRGSSIVAAVLAGISLAPGTAAASASTSATPSLFKGLIMRKFVASIAGTTLLAGSAVLYTASQEGDEANATGAAKAEAVSSRAMTSEPMKKMIASSKVVTKQAERLSLRRISPQERDKRMARFRATLKNAEASLAIPEASAILEGPSDRAIVRAVVAEVRPLIAECYELAVQGDAMSGLIAVHFDVSDEPDILGLVTNAEITRRDGDFDPPVASFEECIEETFMSLEFVGMSRGLAVTYPFVFRDSSQ